ncbi:hypothetical protein [Microtetraspora sp. NBRC 16547]|uniref:hypothetical protein n=1 Tax=Microtetraspora sp. NBRC 16547 TaxID=3030993 RepID=UPI0024A41D70|nr:hypothetical protein [Microtetraspora sp. NBRC 16547]GLW96045.1 hypothetical protein Misp02_01320 [Microtetraspora sp. NBRC 16547]
MKRSRLLVVGLILGGLLGLIDMVGVVLGDGEHPPFALAVAGAVLGLITLGGVVLAWRGSRAGAVAVIVTRLLSGLSAVPAFFVDGVPAEAVGAASVGVVLALVCVALVAPALRSRG